MNIFKKKVVHVTFDMRIGGAEQVICNLIENTDSTKYEISVLCLENFIGPFGRQLQDKGYIITSLNRKPGFDISLISQIRSFIRRNNIDVLHCHQYTPYVYGLLGSIFTTCKVIYTEHGRFYPDQRKFRRILINPLLNLMTDQVTAISEATKDALISFENFPGKNIKVVYNGIDDSKYLLPRDKAFRISLGIPENAFVLGTVARLDSIKNHPMMIRALKAVHRIQPDTYLIIVGDGPERENLEKIVASLKLDSHIKFSGFREDAYRFYKTMDIFLLTSFSEGTAMTLLEAMASGLPCIVTDVGGNPEIVVDLQTGSVVPSDNEEALAKAISSLLENKDLLKQMGRAARRRFEDEFTIDRMVKSYEAMYDRVGWKGTLIRKGREWAHRG